MNTNYWIGVVSEQHVLKGAAGGFAQLCHGKKAPLAKMKEGDWLIYYSPRDAYPDGKLLRSFTAIGKVKKHLSVSNGSEFYSIPIRYRLLSMP
ncbi:EVE domain-containing protein [Bacillus subtilis]|nr:EVE domain-containing protein [Bacillus subtilis]